VSVEIGRVRFFSIAALASPPLSLSTSCCSHSMVMSTAPNALSILSRDFQSHSISRARLSVVLFALFSSLSSVMQDRWRASVVSLLACSSHMVSFISVVCVSRAWTMAVVSVDSLATWMLTLSSSSVVDTPNSQFKILPPTSISPRLFLFCMIDAFRPW